MLLPNSYVDGRVGKHDAPQGWVASQTVAKACLKVMYGNLLSTFQWLHQQAPLHRWLILQCHIKQLCHTTAFLCKASQSLQFQISRQKHNSVAHLAQYHTQLRLCLSTTMILGFQ